MVTQITLAQFMDLYEKEQIEEVLSVTVGSEKRVYGRTSNDPIIKTRTKTVYAVIS